MFKYLGKDIMDEGRNKVIMEQNDYIREKVRIPLLVQEKYERVLIQVKKKIYRLAVGQLNWLNQEKNF